MRGMKYSQFHVLPAASFVWKREEMRKDRGQDRALTMEVAWPLLKHLEGSRQGESRRGVRGPGRTWEALLPLPLPHGALPATAPRAPGLSSRGHGRAMLQLQHRGAGPGQSPQGTEGGMPGLCLDTSSLPRLLLWAATAPKAHV